ncbi:PHB depolymerase family esterase [Paracoccus yeei]|uniref:extracellular catalytic domain type 1 short-chain-length polyhydroxyalkanoate depolymerase n=1 Tax=Paracoccus yeei TaxID=147645 RepID=UPI003BF835A9
MNPFDIGTLRQAMDTLRFEGANDLVQRTLSQHGLAMPLPASGSPAEAPTSDALASGASFTADRFACTAGTRDYLTYVPASAAQGTQGLVLMLHGCTQTHADFARGTGMNALAEEHRLIVVYPQQARGDNAQSCWNWFSRGDQRRGRGEPEILAQLAAEVARAHAVPGNRVFVAGLSAGAAMAVILGQTHPDVFAAVGAHSGLPFGAAKDVPSAFAAMNGTAAPEAMPGHDPVPTPTIVFHGSADRTVHPANGDRIAADALAAGPKQTLFDRTAGKAGARSYVRETTRTPEGDALLERWAIDGLGHAWSGGDPAGSYTDPQGPRASAEMVRFFLELKGA